MSEAIHSSRRKFLKTTAATAAGIALPVWSVGRGAPAILAADSERPQALQGLHFGDPSSGSVVVWSRSDRPARMLVDWSYDEDFRDVQRLRGPHALDTSDFTVRQDLEGLEAGRDVFVRVSFQSLSNDRAIGEPVTGRFVVPPDPLFGEGRTLGHARTDLRFLWSGDTAGQGWGINPGFGGMKIYEAMRQRNPLFFIHSGDTIYADGPIAESVVAERGLLWTNIVTPQVAKVAETLDEFRGRYRYNLLDENVRRFNAEVPQIWQWDDHEVANNWSDSKDLSGDSRYSEKNVPLLVARGARAFLEYAPMRPFDVREAQRVYRRYDYGPLLEVFVLDMRGQRVRNVVWLTADVHYCAAHYYDPNRASFHDFDAFWEFVAGPLNAGTFGPNALDGTFGPQLVFAKTPAPGQSNLSPYSGLQFFGEVNIDASNGTMTVDLRDINGVSVFTKTLLPRMN